MTLIRWAVFRSEFSRDVPLGTVVAADRTEALKLAQAAHRAHVTVQSELSRSISQREPRPIADTAFADLLERKSNRDPYNAKYYALKKVQRSERRAAERTQRQENA